MFCVEVIYLNHYCSTRQDQITRIVYLPFVLYLYFLFCVCLHCFSSNKFYNINENYFLQMNYCMINFFINQKKYLNIFILVPSYIESIDSFWINKFCEMNKSITYNICYAVNSIQILRLSITTIIILEIFLTLIWRVGTCVSNM